MNETRRLDIFARVGGVLALLTVIACIGTIIYGIYQSSKIDESWLQARDDILQRMPDSEVKADFAVTTASNKIFYPTIYPNREKILAQAIRKYPNSARLQFRLGTTVEGPASLDALMKAVKLDPANGATYYALASAEAEKGNWGRATEYLKQGNMCKVFSTYPFTNTELNPKGIFEAVVAQDSGGGNFVLYQGMRFRNMMRAMGKHAQMLQSQGKTDEAVGMLNEARQMGWATMGKDHGNIMTVVYGTNIIILADHYAKPIYESTHSASGLAQLKQDTREIAYLQAGQNKYLDDSMRHLIRNTDLFFSMLIPAAPILLESLLTLFVIMGWIGHSRKSRDTDASELHDAATARAFSFSRMMKAYAAIFVIPGILTAVAAIIVCLTSPAKYFLSAIAIPVIAVLYPVVMYVRGAVSYKRAYRYVAEEAGTTAPRSWRTASRADRREVARRLSGVFGGSMVLLTVLGLMISVGMKIGFGTFPWQPEHFLSDYCAYEKQYTSDLLAHKIVVPEEKIRKAENRLMRQQKRSQIKSSIKK